MSEVQSRTAHGATRGRGSSRGGRGGSSLGARGGLAGRGARGPSGGSADEEQGEVGQLIKQYASELAQLKDLFPDWTREDIVFALDENEGDVQITAEKISEGFTSQWGEVKKKNKDRARSQAKQPAAKDSIIDTRGVRGGRTTFDASRGGRGRGGIADRGTRGGRGGRGGAAIGAPRPVAKPRTDDSSAPSGGTPWGDNTEATPAEAFGKPQTDGVNDSSAEKPPVKTAASAPAVKTTSWASLLKPTPPPPKPVQQKPAAPPAAPPAAAPAPQPAPEKAPTPPQEPEPVAEQPAAPEEPSPAETEEQTTAETTAETTTETAPTTEAPEVEEQQPATHQEPLTEDNLEKIEDVAPSPPTETAASTVATATERQDDSSVSTSVAAPAPAPAPTTPAKQPVSKGTPGRSYKRILQQQEGVVMPGNHTEVNRTALQFGSMGLDGDEEEEEEPEQPAEVPSQPAAQPAAQPSPAPVQAAATLPPTGPAQQLPPQPPIAETVPTPRQAPGIPTQPQAIPQPTTSQQPPLGPQSMTQQPLNAFNQYGRYGVPDQQAKSYESYMQHQQAPQQAAPPAQPQQTQTQQHQAAGYAAYMQQQQPSHLGLGGVSSAPEQHYGNYYADRSQPPGFGLYGSSSYMQTQQAQSQQEAGQNQQRASSGLSGATDPTAQIPSSVSAAGQGQQPTSRYGAADQVTGQATPSPALPTSQTHQSMAQQYPMHFNPYYQQYMHQGYYSQPSPFGGKNMYGYPQQYMSPTYTDSTSPALGGFGSPATQGRDTMGGSLGDYNRMNTSAAQQSLPQQATAGGYGNGIPNFLNTRGLGQDQPQLGGASVGQQPGVPQSQTEDLKFGENKPPTGPSANPSLQGQPGRPGSATSGAQGLGPQQGGQAPAGMYSSHLNPSVHGHQAQQSYGQNQNAYSMYSGGYPNQYPQSNARGGAGWSYGH